MAKLIMSLDNAVIREVPLDKERVTIGRKAHNDIQVDNLAVSGEHAVIVTILNDSFLEDLGSTNGTLVNGNPVKKHILQTNDVIEIGKYKFKYVADQGAGKASVADFEKTMVLRGPVPRAAAAPGAGGFGDTQINTTTTVSSPSHPPASLGKQPEKMAAVQILTGPNAGKELELTKNLTTLGKPGVQVAVITRRPHGHFITHVEGANFPIVNGKPLDAQAHQLNDHDVIELAGVKMEFFLKNS
ncbi:MAG TPA: FHA domain-containing protein [Burkholderiales bacterium]|nr:FHA domain-containing protein [Burkholderiales bacterium]